MSLQALTMGLVPRRPSWLCLTVLQKEGQVCPREASGTNRCRAKQQLQQLPAHLNAQPLLAALCRTGQPPWAAAFGSDTALTCNDLVHGRQQVP